MNPGYPGVGQASRQGIRAPRPEEPRQNPSTAVGYRSAALGDNAVAIGSDGIGVRCKCGFEVMGRAAPEQAEVEAAAGIYVQHWGHCKQINPAVLAAARRILKEAIENGA